MKQRWLVSHPESNDLFEVFTEQDLLDCLNNDCDDVTGIEKWEAAFERKWLGFDDWYPK